MLIGERIRLIREAKHLTQADIEKRTGMPRPHISRLENGHSVPSIETVQKFAAALGVPLYQLFYDGEEPPKPKEKARTKQARQIERLRGLLSRMTPEDRATLLAIASRMASQKASS